MKVKERKRKRKIARFFGVSASRSAIPISHGVLIMGKKRELYYRNKNFSLFEDLSLSLVEKKINK